MGNTSNEIAFANDVINTVLEALPNEGGSSDDFEKPDPTKKRKTFDVVKKKVDLKAKKPRKDIDGTLKKLRLKRQGSKPSSSQKKDECEILCFVIFLLLSSTFITMILMTICICFFNS